MFNIILYQPEIPQNTGNIMRLCSNTGCSLHLIEPLGFALEDKYLRRAHLDYGVPAAFQVHENFQEIENTYEKSRIFLFSTKANTCYSDIAFHPNDCFVFGPETRGLPKNLLDIYPEAQCLRLPMQANSRSINLSNTVAIVVYEAWRQNKFLISQP